MKTVAVSGLMVNAELLLMNHLQKVASAIANSIISSAVVTRFLVMTTLIVKHVLVAQIRYVVMMKVSLVIAEVTMYHLNGD